MKRFLTVAIAAALLAWCCSANAGQIWTDGDGDGFPDGGPINVAPNTNVTVGLWLDSQGFTWTNYLAYVEWNCNCISYLSASYVVTGGSNFPLDDFSHPCGLGFGGSGFNRSGVSHVGNMSLRVNTPVNCCVTPIIDIYNPFYVFSQLGAGSAYFLFTTNPRTCYGAPPPATEACCFFDGSCQNLIAADCTAQGGTPQGPGTSCGGIFCPPPPAREACCFADGSCVEANVGACPAGSTPQGSGTNCSPNLCPPPPPVTEACCFVGGACQDLTTGDCAAAGGISQGPGTVCATTVCPLPEPRGACCIGTQCVIATAAECASAGGLYQGDNTTCQPNPCVNAVESKSWGNIKGLYR